MFGKVFGIVMLPISLVILLSELDIYIINLPFDVVLIGAVLMIAFQLINVFLAKAHNGTIGIMQIITSVLFILPALVFLITEFTGIAIIEKINLIVGVMMLAESMYALH